MKGGADNVDRKNPFLEDVVQEGCHVYDAVFWYVAKNAPPMYDLIRRDQV